MKIFFVGLRRADEGTNSFKCGAKVEPSGGLLSRSMDCAKPTYAWGPIKGLTYNRTSLVIPCRRGERPTSILVALEIFT